MLRTYIKKYGPVYPSEEGRISFVNGATSGATALVFTAQSLCTLTCTLCLVMCSFFFQS